MQDYNQKFQGKYQLLRQNKLRINFREIKVQAKYIILNDNQSQLLTLKKELIHVINQILLYNFKNNKRYLWIEFVGN